MNKPFYKSHSKWWGRGKLLLTTILASMGALTTQAQVSGYTFSASSGTFTPITGGTTLNASILSGGSPDDGYWNNIPIGFNFSYDGQTYNSVAACTNGWLSLVGPMTSNAWTNNLTSGLAGARPVLAPLWDDHDGSITNFTYKSEVVLGDSVFTAEWVDVDWQFQGGAVISFQVKLFKNSGNIQFIYRQEGTAVTGGSASIGISGVGTGSGDFLSLSNSTASPSVSSTTETTNINSEPATGQIYQFTPPPPSSPVVLSGSASSITTNFAVLGGNITSGGYPRVNTSGIVLSTSPAPTIGGFGVVDSLTNPLIRTGTFSINFNGLQSGTTYYYRAYAINPTGTTYGADSVFTTNASAVAPSVLTVASSNTSTTSATIGGNITLDGGAPIMASGVVYSLTPNPAIGGFGVVDSTTNPLVSSGVFSVSPTGLTHSTKYYYRAYATNFVGTTYGIEDSFTTAPIITTVPYFENFDGASTPWKSAAIGGGTNSWQLGTPAKTSLNGAFSAPNAFVTKLSGNYNGTDNCVVESPQFDFSAQTVSPILRFKHRMDVEDDITYDGGVVEISINGGAWTRLDANLGTGADFNTANSIGWYNDGSGNGPLGSPKFSANTATDYSTNVNGWVTSVTPLTGTAGQSDVKVRFRFAADVFTDEGWEIDDIEIILPTAPIVSTGSHTSVTTTNAILNGNILSSGGNAITASGIVIGTSANPTVGTFGVIDSATNPTITSGLITVSLTTLQPGQTYYYRTYAVNGVGITYGADSTFTTNSSALAPSILTVHASNITTTSATIGGNITLDGGAPITSSGVVYSQTPNPAIGGFGVIDSTTNPLVTNGVFNVNPTGFTHSTKYYFRAYATNYVGTTYSIEDSFTTSPIITAVPYSENFDGATTPWASSAINGGTNAWQLGTPTKTNLNSAFSAPNAFVTKLSGSYSGTEDCVVTSPQFDFSAQTIAPVLRFKHRMDVDNDINYDGGVVEISINGGPWTRLDATTGTAPTFNTVNSNVWYNNGSTNGTLGSSKFSSNTATDYTPNTNGWITSSTPLVGSAGQADVKVRFRFWADTYVDEGWEIDDIEIILPTAPIVATGTHTSVTTTNAVLSGNILNSGGNALTASGIVIGTSPNPTVGTFGVIDSTTNPIVRSGLFTISLNSLQPGQTYYYRTYAINAVGTTYGADSTFTTSASATTPSILTLSVTNLTSTSATIGGNITLDGGAPVMASGVVYSLTPNPAIGNFGVIDSVTNPAVISGVFRVHPVGLTHSTKYYFRAYATNSVGTTYGIEDSFVTSPIISGLPYVQNFEGANNTGWSAVDNGGANNWELGTPSKTFLNAAKSGTKAWVTKLTGNYDDYSNASLVSPQFDLSAITSDPVLRFNQKFRTENNYDGIIVELSIDGGQTWNKLNAVVGTGSNFNTRLSYAWYNNNSTFGPIAPPKFSSSTGSTIFASNNTGWIESATRLVGAAGQSNVKVKFTFISDGSGNEEGFAIDDITVEDIATPSIAASNVSGIGGASSVNLTFSPGNGQGRLVVARIANSTVVVAPYDTVLYTANSVFGSGSTVGTGNYVVYSGTGTNVNITGLAQLTMYEFDVYEFNGKYMHNKFTVAASGMVATIPVKLLNFVAVKKSEDGVLNWVTASEANNKGFAIERSLDGKTFEQVHFVTGKGNSNVKVSYSYTDAGVFAKGLSKVYYRLKQMDNDGKYSYSSIVMLANELNNGTEISAYPNPFSSDVTVSVNTAKAGSAKVEVYDISGRKVLATNYEVVEGSNAISLTQLSELQTGIYFVKVQVEGQEKVIKLVKN